MGFQNIGIILLSIAVACIIDSTHAQCTIGAVSVLPYPLAAIISDNEGDNHAIWTFTIDHLADTEKPVTVGFANQAAVLGTYFDIDISPPAPGEATTVIVKTKEAIKGMLDQDAHGADPIDAKLTVTCTGIPAKDVPEALTIQITDDNSHGPTFDPTNAVTISVNLNTYATGAAINTEPAQLINVEDLDGKIEHTRIHFAVLDHKHQLTSTIIARETAFVHDPDAKKYVRSIQLEFGDDVTAAFSATNFYLRAIDIENTDRTVDKVISVAATGDRPPAVTQPPTTTEPNSAGQIGAVFMVTLASFITTWVRL